MGRGVERLSDESTAKSYKRGQARQASSGRDGIGIATLSLLSRLPLSVLRALSRVLYVLVYYVVRLRRDVVFTNLAASFPDWDAAKIERTAKSFYRNLSEVFAEVIKALTMTPAEFERRVEVANLELIEKHCAAGRSVILLAAHHGNWEWAYLALCLKLDYPIHTAYKPPRQAGAQRLIRKIRCRFGGEMIPAKTLTRDLVRRKRLIRCISIVADQIPASAKTKIWLSFLHQETAFYPGPEKIADSLGLPVVFVGVGRTRPGHYRIELEELAGPGAALDEEEVTRRYARAVERQVRQDPANWFWIHRRWKPIARD